MNKEHMGDYDTRPVDPRSERKKNKDSFFASIAYAVITAAFLVSALFAYWTLQPADIVTNIDDPVKVTTPASRSQGYIDIPIEYCKTMELEAQVKRSFVSASTEIFQPEVTENAPKGCMKKMYRILIPPQVINDEYYIKFQATYRINPIKTTTETFKTQKFRVID